MFAGISYTTFPSFDLGPLTIRSFGTLVGIGVVLGAYVAARYLERFGIDREDTYRMGTRMVLWGVIGSRVTWVLSHPEEIDNPIDLIALWEGGIQFSGGFIAALIVGYPSFRKWGAKLRWRSLDGYAYGLVIGLAIGRIGCYSVGEHFGRATTFFLGNTYQGGNTQELIPLPDGSMVSESDPRAIGATFHNTALYEFIHLIVLFALLSFLLWRRRGHGLKAGTITGIFVLWYGIGRFVTDTLRVADSTVLGLTGAQAMTLVMVPAGLWILLKRRHQVEDLPDNEETMSRGDGVLISASTNGAELEVDGTDESTDADASTDQTDTTDSSDNGTDSGDD